MPYIRWIEDEEAAGPLARIYEAWRKSHPGRSRMPEILKCFSLRPDVLQAMMDLSYPLHFEEGFLSRRVKEMIATYVSGLNQCPY
jgi:alkylhydroperoxidase family enzyme